KIESRRTGRREDQPAPLIHNQTGPIVRAAGVAPGVFRPSLVTEFARMGESVKRPSLFARADVERADVAWRGRQRFAGQGADDQHVLVNGAGRGIADRDVPWFAPLKTFSQIDAPINAEALRGLSGLRVERVKPMSKPEEDSLLSAVFPIRNPAISHLA